MTKFNPWWVTGYTDAVPYGSGCFILNIFKNKNVPKGYSAKLVYQITAQDTDHEIMYALKAFFNGVLGKAHYIEYTSYRVYSIKNIVEIILPHFESYPLYSAKSMYFVLWSKCAQLIHAKLHLTEEGFTKLLTYKASFSKKLDAEVFNNKLYSNLVPFLVNNNMRKSNVDLDPNYIAGFLAAVPYGSGSFSIIKPSLLGSTMRGLITMLISG